MRPSSRLLRGALLGTVMLLGATVTPAWAVGGTSVAIVDSSTRVQVEGKILVLAGGDGVSTAVAATPLSDEVRLVTAAGTSVVLTGALTDDVTTGSSFTGTVSIPADAAGDVNAVVEKSLSDVDALPTASTTVDGESEVGQEILAASATLEAPLTVVEATITASADTVQTATAHKLDVAVVTLPTNPAASVMSNTAISTMTVTLSTYWASQSAGQVASISKPAAVQRFVSPNACDPNTVWDEAAAKFGHSANWYWGVAAARHLVVIAPESCGRGIGLGSVGSLAAGGLIWAGYLGIVATSTIAHEFGHNVGLNHSNVQPCSSPALTAASTDPCADQEYEDAYDIMGASFTYRDLSGVERSNRQLMALNVTQKSVLGALNASDLPTVGLPEGVSVSDSAFTLLPASAASGLRGIKATDPLTGDVYFVEYRSGTGMDAGSIYASTVAPQYAPGVRVLRLRANGSSVVLTMPNAVIGTERPLFLKAGQSFAAPDRSVKITVTGVGTTAAVTIHLADTPLPLTTVKPTVTGTTKVGYTLTANPGTWGPATVTLAYKWYRSGTAITGATAKKYKLAGADAGKTLTVKVTGSKIGYTSAAKVSVATAAIAKGTLSAATPTITGTTKVGYTLTANPGTWGPATVTLKYQWYRSDVAITGATAKTYKLVSVDRYNTVTVRVIGSKLGYSWATTYSAPTVTIP